MSDVTKRNRTSLTAAQQTAIDLIILGFTDRQVGERVGRSRETVSRWRANAYFMAELNQRRAEMWRSTGERVRSLLFKALEVIDNRLGDDDLQAALGFLRSAGGVGAILTPPNESTDPEEIINARARELATAEVGPAPPDPLMVTFIQEPTPAEAKYAMQFRAATERYLAELRATDVEVEGNSEVAGAAEAE